MRKGNSVSNLQLSLWAKEDKEIRQSDTKQQSDSVIPPPKELIVLNTYENVIDYLLMWAKKHNYPELEFPLPKSYYGFNTAHFPRGKNAWIDGCNSPFCTEWLFSAARTAQYLDNTEERRAWLLVWGEKHNYPCFGFPFCWPASKKDCDRRLGKVGKGRGAWECDIRPPYELEEHYPGEWLKKCIAHVKRFDSGECSIPENVHRFQLYREDLEQERLKANTKS